MQGVAIDPPGLINEQQLGDRNYDKLQCWNARGGQAVLILNKPDRPQVDSNIHTSPSLRAGAIVAIDSAELINEQQQKSEL
jgi:hypothetical protein